MTMDHQSSAAGDIARYSFLRVFANDGTIDLNEFRFMERQALRDGQIDEKERGVLANIFGRVSAETCTAEVWAEIVAFKAKHQIP
jgi:hypothetical protein